MTRINILPVEELYDQHLMAEFREIQHIPKALVRSLNRKSGFTEADIPLKFTLSKGHVKFFYNKGIYLQNRYLQLTTQLQQRGFNIQAKPFRIDLFPQSFLNDWTPSQEDIELITSRIAERINLKKHWYRKTLIKIKDTEYNI